MQGEFFVMRKVPCPKCNGEGSVLERAEGTAYAYNVICKACQGKGFDVIEVSLVVALRALGITVPCPDGAGKVESA